MAYQQKEQPIRKFRACKICMYSHFLGDALEGECRSNPPRGALEEGTQGSKTSRRFFPPISFTDWCGRFRVIDDKEKTAKLAKEVLHTPGIVTDPEERVNLAVENLEDAGEWEEALKVYESAFEKAPSSKLAERIFNVRLKFDMDNKERVITTTKKILSFSGELEERISLLKRELKDVVALEELVEIYESVFEENPSAPLAEAIYNAYKEIGNDKDIKMGDNEKLFEWAKKGAELDWAEGYFSAGLFFFRGIVCEQDKDKANKYLKRSAELGYEKAQKKIEKGGYTDEIPDD